eukprot:NODE_1857_length_1781_cov_6.559107_g1576_i0.p1 GENE.NODE_1857_length_1781_cov_6.559107_g1576_i0~~NODE_1857_length_1781_cov_6.559107_g1576_i0.p1  ORF type:complete len:568 (-),score=48.66 NODE_1857_length_1781_cov_6.559107_g1576_i0:23-1726(-)
MKLFVPLLIIFFSNSVSQQVGYIYSYAGNSNSGITTSDTAGTSALLTIPTGIFMNANYIYITDKGASSIRRLDTTTGILSFYAGSTTGGKGYLEGFRTNAQFNDPYSVFANNDYVWIADSVNFRVRLLTLTTGIVSTVAGNTASGNTQFNVQATSSSLKLPYFIYADNSNNFWISDHDQCNIIYVDWNTRIISRVAGQNTCGYNLEVLATNTLLNNPHSIYVDASSILVADSTNNRIRSINRGTGVITTIAGTGSTTNACLDGTLATSCGINPFGVHSDNDYIWFTDYKNNRVRRISKSTGTINIVAGSGVAGTDGDGGLATSAKINKPDAVYYDGKRCWITDSGGFRIRAAIIKRVAIASILGDPHFTSFSGGRYTIDGLPNKTYSLWSDTYVQWNAEFILRPGNHHVRSLYLGRNWFNLFGFKIEIDPTWKLIINGITVMRIFERIDIGPKTKRSLFHIRYYSRRLSLRIPCVNIIFLRAPKWTAAASKRVRVDHLNLMIQKSDAWTPYCRSPHGLIGQTMKFAFPVEPLGTNGEGVIDGKINDYIVNSPWSCNFTYNRKVDCLN